MRNPFKRQVPKEHAEQVSLVAWWRTAGCRLVTPVHRELFPAQLWSIPNGGTSNAIMGRQLNAEGRLAGVADLFLQVISPRPEGGMYGGLFVEMKRQQGGRQSETQRNFEALCWLTGYAYVLCKGCTEAQQKITDYLTGYLQRPDYAHNIQVINR